MEKSTFSNEKWFQMLIKSINNRVVDGVDFPGFPNESIQAQFVGSSNEAALREGFEFYKTVKGYSAALGMPLNNRSSKLLDFGCGWGRYLRFFLNDIAEENLFGCDIDPTILEGCRENGVKGQLDRIFPDGKLPYPDAFFDCVIAYSVFTHLPEHLFNNWIKEIARVSKPGCVFVFTLESVRFLDFIETIDKKNPPTGWHAGLSHFAGNVPEYRKTYSEGNFVYLPTGGGDFRSADVYGDAVVPRKYFERTCQEFNVIDYLDDRFWQAVLIAQRS